MRSFSEIAPNRFRFNGDTFYGSPVGSYGIVTDDHVVLIDVPRFDTERSAFVASFDKPVVCLLSHGPTGIADAAKWRRANGVRIFLHGADVGNEWLKVEPDVLIGDALPRFGSIELLHTPGHTPGSIIAHDHASGIVFAGDSLGGTDDGDVRDFLNADPHNDDPIQRFESIRRFADRRFDAVYPFHYAPILRDADRAVRRFVDSVMKQESGIQIAGV